LDGNRIRQDSGDRWKEDKQYTVKYVGGYSAVPAGLKMAILHLIARAFDNRGGKERQGAEGWGVTWDNFADGEMRQLLQPYRAGKILA